MKSTCNGSYISVCLKLHLHLFRSYTTVYFVDKVVLGNTVPKSHDLGPKAIFLNKGLGVDYRLTNFEYFNCSF